MKKLFICSLFIFLLSGCVWRKEVSSVRTREHQEVIAKFSDIPDAPFAVNLLNLVIDENNHDQLQLFYTISIPVQDVLVFYEQQMERLGWDMIAQSNLHDNFLIFSKPNKICSLLIINNKLTLYISNRKDS